MKSSILYQVINHKFLIIAALVLLGCQTFEEIGESIAKSNMRLSEAFDGKNLDLCMAIKHKYEAQSVTIGISWSRIGNEESEWVSLSILNGKELSEGEEYKLARAIYRLMDTSLVNGNSIEVINRSKTGSVVSFSSTSNTFYAYHELDENIVNPELSIESSINVLGVLDSLIALDENKCNTKFYSALSKAYQGDKEGANIDFLSFERCDVDRNYLGRFYEANRYIVRLIYVDQASEVEIKEGIEFLVPHLDSLDNVNYALFGEF